MNRKVTFTAMDHGSREDYDLVEAHDAMNAAGLADRGPDQVSFDPAYRTHPLEHYEPLVREMFARPSRTFL